MNLGETRGVRLIGGADLLKFETRDLFQNDSNQTQYCELTIATAIGPLGCYPFTGNKMLKITVYDIHFMAAAA